MLSSMYRWIVSVILSLRQFSGTRATPGRVVKRWDRVVTILGKGRLSWLVELVVWGQNTGSATRTGDSHLCLLDVLFTLFSAPILSIGCDGAALHYLWLVLMHAYSPFRSEVHFL